MCAVPAPPVLCGPCAELWPGYGSPRGAVAGERSLCSAQEALARFLRWCYRRLPHVEGLLCGRDCGGGI